jgi:hypothetical protein
MKISVTYHDLVNKPFCLSRMLARNATVITVTDTPRTKYAQGFAERLKAADKLPCDIPGKHFCMKKAPEFIFVLEAERVRIKK